MLQLEEEVKAVPSRSFGGRSTSSLSGEEKVNMLQVSSSLPVNKALYGFFPLPVQK
jgi:hypothetical protein